MSKQGYLITDGISTQGRYTTLLNCGLSVIKSGKTVRIAMGKIRVLNRRFKTPLNENELSGTVLTAIRQAFYKKERNND